MASRQLSTLQAGRALAAISVVLQHVHYLMLSPQYYGVRLGQPLEAAKSGVQFFFVLSGFVIYLAHRNDIGKPATLRSFAWKRFRRIYPPLWIILALVLAAFVLIPSFGVLVDKSPATILSAFLILPSPTEHLLFVEWTLRHEVLFYAIFALLLLHRRIGWIVLGIWIGLSAIVPWLHPSLALDFTFNTNHVLFGLGIAVCMAFQRYRLPISLARFTLLAGLATFAFAWWWQCHLPDPYLNPPANILLFGLGAAIAILGLVQLERGGVLRAPAALIFLGEASYAIYLIHQPATVLTAKLLRMTSFRHLPVASMVVLVISGVVIGILFHVLLERPVTRLLSRKRTHPTSVSV